MHRLLDLVCRVISSALFCYGLHLWADWVSMGTLQLLLDALRFAVWPSVAVAGCKGLDWVCSHLLKQARQRAAAAPQDSSNKGLAAVQDDQQQAFSVIRQLLAAAWLHKLQEAWSNRLGHNKAANDAAATVIWLYTKTQATIRTAVVQLSVHVPNWQTCLGTVAQVLTAACLVSVLAEATYSGPPTGPNSSSTASHSSGGGSYGMCDVTNSTRVASSADPVCPSVDGLASSGTGAGVLGSAQSTWAGHLGSLALWQLSAAIRMFDRMDLQIISQTVRYLFSSGFAVVFDPPVDTTVCLALAACPTATRHPHSAG